MRAPHGFLALGLGLVLHAPGVAAGPEPAAVDALTSVAEVRALVVLREDSSALEWYRTPADAGATNVKSASKSVLSALIGIALERERIPGVDVAVAELLPEHADLLAAPPRDGITLRHLLSMTAGLESTSGAAYGAWVSGDHWLRGALSRPVVAAPGREFVYSTGSSHVVAAILERATRPRGLVRWAREVLFDPAGIGRVSWQRAPEGLPFGGNNMAMTPLDLARFGRLWLVGGDNEGDRIVPAAWVAAATTPAAEGWPERYGAYGLGWWLPGGGPFLAVGFGGQFLWVDPERRTVVVVASTSSQKGAAWDRHVLDLVRRIAAGSA